jgi:NADH-quinone oxidoreductase subunit G
MSAVSPPSAPAPDLVTITIDGKELKVPKGTNLIEAAKMGGIEIPHYCYHPDLSVAGNCRMCQVMVNEQTKLTIACNTPAAEGMKVNTQHTRKEVQDAQAATLEFILINHPLDCTVCDQAGHCKLQDYHFQYNARPSRMLEQKVHKVKAEPLGPNVVLDGERCIMCTRCIRFCDEITQTSELGMLNRGDSSVIAASPGRPLANALSGTVVDLCPVGALTHREWRFNTRIWFTRQTDSICPGCSTGCSVKVAERDGRIVQVKARYNKRVNKEWLCDEGRYGFDRFLPEKRITAPLNGKSGRAVSEADAINGVAKIFRTSLIFVAPDLMLEEYVLLKKILTKVAPTASAVVAYRPRSLTKEEAILVSPDYAANIQGARWSELVGDDPQRAYEDAIEKVKKGEVPGAVFIGDRSVEQKDFTPDFFLGLTKLGGTAGILCDAESPLTGNLDWVLPARSVLEKSGLLINQGMRAQYAQKVVEAPEGVPPTFSLLDRLGQQLKVAFFSDLSTLTSERDLTRAVLRDDTRFGGATIAQVRDGGVVLPGSSTGGAARV